MNIETIILCVIKLCVVCIFPSTAFKVNGIFSLSHLAPLNIVSHSISMYISKINNYSLILSRKSICKLELTKMKLNSIEDKSQFKSSSPNFFLTMD